MLRGLGRGLGRRVAACSPHTPSGLFSLAHTNPSTHTGALVSVICNLGKKDAGEGRGGQAPARSERGLGP